MCIASYITGARSAQGAANRRRPLHPRLWRTKSPLRGALGLSLTATGRARGNIPVKRALSPHPCGLPGLQGTPRQF